MKNPGKDSPRFSEWFDVIIDHGNRYYFAFRQTHSDFLAAVKENKNALAGKSLHVNARNFHLDYLDAFLTAGITLKFASHTSPYQPPVEFFPWVKHHLRDLSDVVDYLENNPDFADSVLQRLTQDERQALQENPVTSKLTHVQHSPGHDTSSLTPSQPQHFSHVVQADDYRMPPVPPLPVICNEELSAHIHRCAEVFRSLRNRDIPQEIGWVPSFLTETFGREKAWLAWLASPALPLELVRSYHGLLSWCAEHGLLGQWHRISVPVAHPPDRFRVRNSWDGEKLVLAERDEDVVLWHPDCVQPPTMSNNGTLFDGELTLSADRFRFFLDQVLSWQENRHTSGETRPEESVVHKASQIAAVTVLPPCMWRLLFCDPFWRVDDFTVYYDTEETDHTLHQLLSVSPSDLEVFRENTNALFLHPFLLLGMAWHEDYLATGPDIQHIATAWERLFGRPWIHITDAMWVDLPRKLQRQLVRT